VSTAYISSQLSCNLKLKALFAIRYGLLDRRNRVRQFPSLLPLDASSSCETSTACQNTVTVVSKLGRSFDN
jgi:hypothetical protein